jgi:uncharacterized protein YktA (UPF0223 family)
MIPAEAKPKAPQDFAELGKFGEFRQNFRLAEVDAEIALPADIVTAQNGVLFFQVLESLTKPVKDIAKIEDEAREFYYQTLAAERVEEKSKSFRELVRSKAEELKKDEVAEHKKKIEERTENRFKSWLDDRQKRLAHFNKMLEDPNRPERALAALRQQKEEIELELEKQADVRAGYLEDETEKRKEDLDEIVSPAMAEAFALAVAEQKLETQTMGPYYSDENASNRFRLVAEGARKFLVGNWSINREPEEGQVTDVLNDIEAKTRYVALLKKVESGGDEAVTRRQMKEKRSMFESERFKNVLHWGWDFESLKKRYQYKEAQ